MVGFNKYLVPYFFWFLMLLMQSFDSNFQTSDLQPISIIQHELMDHLLGEGGMNHQQAKEKIDALVREMYVLEHKY